MALSEKMQGGLTLDKIIEKFIPVVWVLFFVVGLGYLIYNSIWIDLPIQIKLGLGFFLSVAIIGWGFSFSERLSYFADVIIGWGILLLYGTLIYGSRTTDIGAASIPETASIVTASIFTIAASYFASLRKSKVILALVLIGAYMTPFVIGWEWGTSMLSFNTYLLYFFVANVTIFLLWREIAINDLIPLNILWLFIGTSSLYTLSYRAIPTESLLTSWTFTAILFTWLVIFSVYAIIFSSERFEKKYEGYVTFGYIVPIFWFMFNISLMNMNVISNNTIALLYWVIAIGYFFWWYILRKMSTRYQHVALYVGGIIALISWLFVYFPELNFYSSLIISYASTIFAIIYLIDPTKWERLLSYWLFAGMGGILSLYHLHSEAQFSAITFWTFIALAPALLAYPIGRKMPEWWHKNETMPIMKAYSIVALIIILMNLVSDLIEKLSFSFIFFILPAFCIMLYAKFSQSSTNARWHLLRISIAFLTIGFIGSFFYFVWMLIPHAADRLTLARLFSQDDIWNWIFALVTIFLGLNLSREIQKATNSKRPSFLLVIFGYAILLLMVNTFIIVAMNDLGVSMSSTGWPRAIATTFWWILLSVWMISVWVILGDFYRSEKLLGLMLLALTVWKIVFYDMETMSTNNKIIVLMIVGGWLMIFSYFFHSKKPALPNNN